MKIKMELYIRNNTTGFEQINQTEDKNALINYPIHLK
jgi:hypothetical protein